MIRLLYISQSAPATNEEQIQDIIKSSNRNNPTAGITGVLVIGGGMFLQVLEGPEHNVLRQYVKIMDDKRHIDSQIISISPIKSQMFEKWSMGLIEANPLQFQQISGLRARRIETVESKTFADIIRNFAKMLNAQK